MLLRRNFWKDRNVQHALNCLKTTMKGDVWKCKAVERHAAACRPLYSHAANRLTAAW